MKCTLREWQTSIKPKEEILFNCSEFDKQNDEWVPFSIGVSVAFADIENMLEMQIGPHDQLVFCAINEWTDNRRRGHQPLNRHRFMQTLAANGIINSFVDPKTYFSQLPKHKFVVSPEGNGIDCHRHYEAILAGAIPIVEYHEGIQEKYKNLPVLYTHDYSEINEAYLEEKYQEMIDETYDFSNMFLSNHCEEFRKQIIANGNYWGERCKGITWYKC